MPDFTAIFALFCIFIAPLWLILHYTTKRRQAQSLSREDEKMLSELWELANKMESRVNSLETILDTQVPGWRNKA
ncbi:MAG TPA: envelope stress response membrane protein PspB [Rhodanobacteraceae bacterium]|nr:envelope stress response membrane protein PspB [Rhodanobacteraceae bacterium]HET8554744.1 envelope stress response membrane protein PspB [Rhodanobacteraceae bacterium]